MPDFDLDAARRYLDDCPSIAADWIAAACDEIARLRECETHYVEAVKAIGAELQSGGRCASLLGAGQSVTLDGPKAMGDEIARLRAEPLRQEADALLHAVETMRAELDDLKTLCAEQRGAIAAASDALGDYEGTMADAIARLREEVARLELERANANTLAGWINDRRYVDARCFRLEAEVARLTAPLDSETAGRLIWEAAPGALEWSALAQTTQESYRQLALAFLAAVEAERARRG